MSTAKWQNIAGSKKIFSFYAINKKKLTTFGKILKNNTEGKEFFRTCNVLPSSCTHLALWRGKAR